MSNVTIIKGPCRVDHMSTAYLSAGPVKLTYVPSEFDVQTDLYGTADRRRHYGYYTIEFEPTSTWANMGTVLHALAGRGIGADVFSDDYTDALVITPLSAAGGTDKVTLARTALTKCPAIRLGVKTPFFGGPVTFTAIAPVSGSLIAYASAGTPTTPSFDPAAIITRHWSNHWDLDPDSPTSGHPWNGLETEAGWTLNFETSYNETVVDGCGLAAMTITDQAFTASCRPVGVTEAQILTALRAMSMTPGDSLGALTRKMRWTYDTLTIESPRMGLSGAESHWSTKELRNGTLTWKAVPYFASGQRQPLVAIDEE